MAIGEIIGILFVAGVVVVFLLYAYRATLCPNCRGFRTMKTVETQETPLDTETDALELAVDLIDGHHGRHKSTLVAFTRRCSRCGYEAKGKQVYYHR